MLLSTLVEGLETTTLIAGDVEPTSLTIDPSKVTPGALFVARRGWYYDTHARLQQVIDAGAAAVIVCCPEQLPASCSVPALCVEREDPFLGLVSARFFEHPCDELRVFGVTGTNGKTSIAYLLEHMLTSLGERPAVMGTIEYRFGARRWPAPNTTPDGVVIQRFAREVLDLGATALVMEVSSHGLEIERTAGVTFDSVGFTNLSPDHLDFHGDLERYLDAKKRLFSHALAASVARGKTPVAVAAVDGPEGHAMLDVVPAGLPRLAVVSAPDADGQAASRRAALTAPMTASWMRFAIEDGDSKHEASIPLVGYHNLQNVIVAQTMVEGVFPTKRDELLASLESFAGIPGRFEQPYRPREGEPVVFIDHAHTADSIERILPLLRAIDDAPTTIVVGCGGDRDATKRRPMARASLNGADHSIFTTDNPRGEPPAAILAEMSAEIGEGERERASVIEDRTEAIEVALSRPGIILVAGRGHEVQQKVNGARYNHNDREEVRRIVSGRRRGLDAASTPLLCGWSPERVAAAVSGQWRSRGPKRPSARFHRDLSAINPDDVVLTPSLRALPEATWRTLAPSLIITREGSAGIHGVPVVAVAQLDAATLALSSAIIEESRARAGSLTIIQAAPTLLTALRDALTADDVLLLAPTHEDLINGLAPKHRVLLTEADVVLREGDLKLSGPSQRSNNAWVLWRREHGHFSLVSQDARAEAVLLSAERSM